LHGCEFYDKQQKDNPAPMMPGNSNDSEIYVLAKSDDGSVKVLSSMGFKASLTSILRQISKDKSQKYANLMNIKLNS